MATSILLKFLTLEWNISRTIWRIEVGDGSFLCIFHALSFELNFYFDRRFPLIVSLRASPKKLRRVLFDARAGNSNLAKSLIVHNLSFITTE